MAGNAFIKFYKDEKAMAFVGEGLQSTHQAADGWLEISDWSWDIESETNFLKGTGAAVGVATPGVLSFSHTFDRSSPWIMKNIVLGTSFAYVTIHMLKSTGASDGKPEVFFGIKCKEAFMTKVSSKGGEDGAIGQDVEFVFKAIGIGYKRQLNNGKLEEKVREFGWDIATKGNPSYGVTLNPKSD